MALEASRPTPAAIALPGRAPTKQLGRARWRWIAYIAVAVALAAGGRAWMAARASQPVPVRVHTVARGSVRDFVTSVTTGRISARREVNLRAEVSGTVKTLHHRRGDLVPAGGAIVSYDPEELRDRLRVAQSAVEVAGAQVAQAEASAHMATANAERAEALAKRGAIARAEADTLDDQSAVAQKGRAAARAVVHQSGANVELARLALSKAIVRAPFPGTVITTSVEEGDVTVPGAPLLAFADLSLLYAEADIDESDLGRIAVGMPADVVLDAFPDERFRGRVTEIAPSVTRDVRGNRSVAVRVDLAPDPRLRLGMSADVEVIATTREDVVFIPPTAVIGRGAGRSVYVVAGGKAQRRSIEVGVSTWEAVEVKSGLRPGEEVVISLATGNVSDGTRVSAQR